MPSMSPLPLASGSRLPRRLGMATLVVALGAAFAGCADRPLTAREQGTATGAAIGAVSGAVIGKATGGRAGSGAVVGGLVGAVAGNLWSKHMEEKQRALEQATQGTSVEVVRTADNRIKLNIPSDFSFDTGRAAIKPVMKPVLDEVARNLQTDVRIEVVGHTDSTGSVAVNQPLSVERADAVRSYLAARGVPSQRVSIDGVGAAQPIASNETAAGRAMNRRVEIFLAEKAG